MKTLQEVKATFREGGLRALRKKYGWKMLAAVFGYYLVRDTTLYILIPLWGFKALF